MSLLKALGGVLGVALAVLGVVAIYAAIFGVLWFSAPARGKLQAREQINSGSFRIAAYNHFFDACASIQGLQGQLAAQEKELKSATGDDKARVQANIAGIEGDVASAIADYNADANKSYTVGQFRSNHLPYQLDPSEVHVTCAVG